MISFLFFVKIAQNGELRSGDLFPHVFLFPERSKKTSGVPCRRRGPLPSSQVSRTDVSPAAR